MPDMWMDVDVALAEVPVNKVPLVDDTDFKTREESVAYNAAGMDLVWNFVTTAGAMTQTAVTPTTAGVHDWSNQGNGLYSLEIPASSGTINNDTEGFGWFTGVATGVMPWAGPVIGFRAAALNNALIDGGDELDVNVIKVGNTTQTAADLGVLPTRIGGTITITSGRVDAMVTHWSGNQTLTMVDGFPSVHLGNGTTHGGSGAVLSLASLSTSGTVSAGQLSTTGDMSIGGDFAVTGAISAGDGLSLSKTDATTATVNIAGNHSLGPSIRITNSGSAALVTAAGNVTFGNVSVSGTSSMGTVTGNATGFTGLVVDATKIAGNTTAATNLSAGARGAVPGTCTTGSSSTSIVTTLTEATDDHYNGRVITFLAGDLTGQTLSITDYNGTTKTLTVVNNTADAPGNGDTFVIT